MQSTIKTALRYELMRAACAATAILLALAFAPTASSDEADVKKVKDAPKADVELKLTAAEGLPMPDELFARYIKAMGGEAAIRQHTSLKASGPWRMPAMGMEGRFRIFASAPSNMLMVLEAPGMGEIRTGYNGVVGWMSGDLVGATLMEARELADMKIDADFYYPVTFRNHFSELRTVEKAEFADAQCYHVRGKRRTGDEVSIYFNEDTGMMIGTSGVRTSEHGEINVVIFFSEFMEIGGMKIPRVMRMQMPDLGIEQHFHTDEISHGDVDLAVFEVPEAIRRIIERKEKEAAMHDSED